MPRLSGTQLALLFPHLIQHIYVLDIRVVHANSPFCSPHHEDEPRQDVSHELSPQLDVVRHLVSFRQPHSKHVGLDQDRFSHLIHLFRCLGSVSRRTLLLFLRWVGGSFVLHRAGSEPSMVYQIFPLDHLSVRCLDRRGVFRSRWWRCFDRRAQARSCNVMASDGSRPSSRKGGSRWRMTWGE